MKEGLPRKSVSQEGRIFFTCAYKGCTFTIASVGTYDGRPRFKINLKGMERIDNLNQNGRHVEDDKLLDDKSTLRSMRKLLHSAYQTSNTGGKCRQCGRVHSFTNDEIAQAIGFKDTASALLPILDASVPFWDQPRNLERRFLAAYVYRSDIDLQAMFAEPVDSERDPFGEDAQ